jgi:hypothetical protein
LREGWDKYTEFIGGPFPVGHGLKISAAALNYFAKPWITCAASNKRANFYLARWFASYLYVVATLIIRVSDPIKQAYSSRLSRLNKSKLNLPIMHNVASVRINKK